MKGDVLTSMLYIINFFIGSTHSGPHPSCLHTTSLALLEKYLWQAVIQFPRLSFTLSTPSHLCLPPWSCILGRVQESPDPNPDPNPDPEANPDSSGLFWHLSCVGSTDVGVYRLRTSLRLCSISSPVIFMQVTGPTQYISNVPSNTTAETFILHLSLVLSPVLTKEFATNCKRYYTMRFVSPIMWIYQHVCV
jgi:hypothetical protein